MKLYTYVFGFLAVVFCLQMQACNIVKSKRKRKVFKDDFSHLLIEEEAPNSKKNDENVKELTDSMVIPEEEAPNSKKNDERTCTGNRKKNDTMLEIEFNTIDYELEKMEN